MSDKWTHDDHENNDGECGLYIDEEACRRVGASACIGDVISLELAEEICYAMNHLPVLEAENARLREILGNPCAPGTPIADWAAGEVAKKMEAEVARLREEVEAWRSQASNIMAEKYSKSHGSVHCTCVMPLRREVARLTTRLEAAEAKVKTFRDLWGDWNLADYGIDETLAFAASSRALVEGEEVRGG